MAQKFKKIGLMGRKRSSENAVTLETLCDYLYGEGFDVTLEQETATLIENKHQLNVVEEDFGKDCDLVIVVGGDGSLLNTARMVVDFDTPVLGINRGRLGFLTDIHPKDATERVAEVLAGEYTTEKRFLLESLVTRDNKIIQSETALNDVVIMPGEYAHMLEIEVYINKEFVSNIRADGLIIATPTGSTAYSLAGGGPIMHSTLDAILLVPMLPQSLSSRPIVIQGSSEIDIVTVPIQETSPQISCDGQKPLALEHGDKIHIHKKAKELSLLHPKDYQYFETLRKKLHWEKKVIEND